MFVYQNEKLYAEVDDTLVGVNITPTGVSLLKMETATYENGKKLTLGEVRCKFGDMYTFHTPVVEKDGGNDPSGKIETPVKHRGGRPRRST